MKKNWWRRQNQALSKGGAAVFRYKLFCLPEQTQRGGGTRARAAEPPPPGVKLQLLEWFPKAPALQALVLDTLVSHREELAGTDGRDVFFPF